MPEVTENSRDIVEFWDDGNKISYDASTPANSFAAFLEEFLKYQKSGRLDDDPNLDKVKQIVKLLDRDFYEAGREAYHYIRGNPKFLFRFTRIK